MARKTDKQLGMNRDITRRDLIHHASVLTGGLMLPLHARAKSQPAPNPADYPPVRTGLRGSHPGSFEAAHALALEGKTFPSPQDLNEQYDLVVVGAGISGLAAALYYRDRFGKSARILVIENHDDFGGHARRNEFHQGGKMRLSLGGTHNLEHWNFSDTVNAMMQRLGVDIAELRRNSRFSYGREGRNRPALWFDEETYGENKLLTNAGLEIEGKPISRETIEQFPVSKEAREQLIRLFHSRENLLEHLDEEAAAAYLSSVSYTEFLQRYAGIGDEALQLFDNASHGAWGIETRALSASEAMEDGLPGYNLLGGSIEQREWDYPAAFYPDGNASIARLMMQKLVPQVAPGSDASNIAIAKFDYAQLDKDGSPGRIRLNSTVTNVANTRNGVAVTYLHEGQPLRVMARHCVTACYHSILPYLCPDFPEEQKEAQSYQVKIPLLLTNVLLRSGEAMDKLGITGITCPGRMHAQIFMFHGINNGGYRDDTDEPGPVTLTLWGSVSPPADAVDLKDQLRASRTRMLDLTFEDYEREVRTVLDGLLGPAGFDVQKDILAITVNRWPHGYAYEYMDLWDPDWAPGKAPHEIASKPFGNIAIANADAGAEAYTHVAIDQAFRAVQELPGFT
jgi:spermidine dehydrogenase